MTDAAWLTTMCVLGLGGVVFLRLLGTARDLARREIEARRQREAADAGTMPFPMGEPPE
jgi:hypothetical protein